MVHIPKIFYCARNLTLFEELRRYVTARIALFTSLAAAPNELFSARHASCHRLNNTHIPAQPVIAESAVVARSRIRDLDHPILGIPRVAVGAVREHIAVEIVT